MEKYAWRGKIVPGMQEEYKKRHDNIWPEMKEVLANAGIVNYSIWMQGEELSQEERAEYWAIVVNNSEMLLTLLNDILDISSLERSEEHTLNSSHDRQSRMPSSA